MPNNDLARALTAITPTSKAARVREVMPVIEQRIAAGVRIADILKTLQGCGIDLTETTLKCYLYRNRKKGKHDRRQEKPSGLWSTGLPASAQVGESASHEADSPPTPTPGGPVSMQDLDRLMNPNPAKQAEEMAYYERLARRNRRSRKP